MRGYVKYNNAYAFDRPGDVNEVTWGVTIAFALMLAGFAGALGHFADSRSSGLRGKERDMVEWIADRIFLGALALIAIRAVASLVALL